MATKFTGEGFVHYGEKIWDALEDGMRKAVAAGEATSKRAAPVDTGELRGSISHQVEREPKRILGTIYTNIEYAPHQEWGTRNGVKGKFFMHKGLATASKKFIAVARAVEDDVK